MRNALIKFCCLWIALASSVIPTAKALEVDDPEHGFHFSLPDDFIRDPKPKEADVLYLYKRSPKEPGQPATVVEVTAVNGTIAVGERINSSKLPTEEGANIGFDQIEWQTHKLDVVIVTAKDPAKAHVAVYTVLFPLSGQAIRFRVAGASGGDDPARAFFDKTVASFTNTKPLKMNPERSESEKMGAFIFKLGFGILVAVVFGRMIVRMAKGKPKKPKGPPPQAGPPVIRRPG
jgi:hypothetical protein